MPRLSLAKLIEKCCEFESKKQKIEALQFNAKQNPAMLTILKYMFDPKIVFLLPKSDPPYNPLEFDEPGRLYVDARKLYLFIEGGNNAINPFKRESLFISLLESVNVEDANLLLHLKNKKSPYKGLTKKLVQEAFPGLISDE
jgi:hypothetical protein